MADNKASEYEAGLKEKEKKYYAEITACLRERERANKGFLHQRNVRKMKREKWAEKRLQIMTLINYEILCNVFSLSYLGEKMKEGL